MEEKGKGDQGPDHSKELDHYTPQWVLRAVTGSEVPFKRSF